MLASNFRFFVGNLALLIGSALYPLQAQPPSFAWPDGRRAAISLSFDDARASHPEVGKDVFRELGLRATFYVVPGRMAEHLEDWKAILADGHEIGNHTVHHPCTGNFAWSKDKALENYTLATMRRELLTANQQIHDMLGVLPVSFAYTCGNTFVGRGAETKSYAPLVAELFQSGRGWLNEAANDPAFVDLAMVQGIEMDGKDFEQDILPLIEAAMESGSWLVLAGHEIGTEGPQTTRIDMLEKLAAYVQQREDELWTAPVGTVAAYIEEQRHHQAAELAEALLFASTFDHGLQAEFAAGDRRLYSAPGYDQHGQGTPGLLPEEVELAEHRGIKGHALEFKRKGKPAVFYQAEKNAGYAQGAWSGTVSLWLSLDPETDLAPGYTDPIQITDSGYDDAALWVDFTQENPRAFRMGAFGDVDAWNPDELGPDDNASFQNRLVQAEYRPFERGRWTHIAITFEDLNTERGTASLYVDGRPQGSRSVTEPFTWNEAEARIFLGLNYIGLMDEVALFDRAFSEEEVASLYGLIGGLGALLD